MTADNALKELSLAECMSLLRETKVGRIATVSNLFPVVMPVNYGVVERHGRTWFALRTRPGNVIDQDSVQHVALQIDCIDAVHHTGWSVLVRGTLQRVDPDAADFRARFDPQPWFDHDRDAWLVLEPFDITGRALHPAETEWAFSASAYL